MDDLDEEKPTAQQKPPSGGLRWGKGGEVPAGVRTRVEEYCRTSSGLDRRPENGPPKKKAKMWSTPDSTRSLRLGLPLVTKA